MFKQNNLTHFYNSFYNTVKYLLFNSLSNVELISNDNRYDFYLPYGLAKLSISEESYIEIKCFTNASVAQSFFNKARDYKKFDNNVFFIINISKNDLNDIKDEHTLSHIITIERLTKLEYDIQNETLNNYDKNGLKLNKIISFDDIASAMLFHIRYKIASALKDINIQYDTIYNLSDSKYKIFPFLFGDYLFINTNTKETNNYDFYYKEKILITGMRSSQDGFSFKYDKQRYFIVNKDEELASIIASYLSHNIKSYVFQDSKSLYKYKKLYDNNNPNKIDFYTNKTIVNNDVFLAPKQNLNDPFDLDYHYAVRRYFANQKNISLSFKQNMTPCLLLSLSTKPNDILMWSHYGDSHSGICFEYPSFDLFKTIDACPDVSFAIYGAVNYSYKRPSMGDYKHLLKYLPFSIVENIFQLEGLFTKYKSWEYEEEHRFIVFMNDPSIHQQGYTINVPYTKIYLSSNAKIINEKYLHSKTKNIQKYSLDKDKYLLK